MKVQTYCILCFGTYYGSSHFVVRERPISFRGHQLWCFPQFWWSLPHTQETLGTWTTPSPSSFEIHLRKRFLSELIHLIYNIHMDIKIMHIGLNRPNAPHLHLVLCLKQLLVLRCKPLNNQLHQINPNQVATTLGLCAILLVHHLNTWCFKKIPIMATSLSTLGLWTS